MLAGCSRGRPVVQGFLQPPLVHQRLAGSVRALTLDGVSLHRIFQLVREGQWNERYFAEAANWGANVVRFAVHPSNINAPMLISDWDFTPTTQGRFFKSYLQGKAQPA